MCLKAQLASKLIDNVDSCFKEYDDYDDEKGGVGDVFFFQSIYLPGYISTPSSTLSYGKDCTLLCNLLTMLGTSIL